MSAPTLSQTEATDPASHTAGHGLAAHSHVGGRTVNVAKVESHLHPIGSFDVADHPVPTGKEEIWRFTPLRRVRNLHADAEFRPGVTDRSWTAPDGVDVRLITEPDEVRALRGAAGYLPTDRMSARVLAELPATLLVDVPAQTQASEPIVLTLKGSDASATEAGHVVLRFGAFAKADVVLVHEGSTTLGQVVEIDVADGAQVTITSLQEWADDTVHLAHHHVRVGRDARVKHSVLTFGGDLVRVSTSAEYAGPGGDIELLGLYFADAGQHLEHRLFVDHAVPHCKSRALYKGALQGASARTVWIGDVLIRKAAESTDTYEMNRNLVLTAGARADSVPNLEIETGEIIGAGHASATGRFDDDQLFYLLSRGIPSDIARRLVVRGFFGEVLLRLGVPTVVDRATATIERELAITGY